MCGRVVRYIADCSVKSHATPMRNPMRLPYGLSNKVIRKSKKKIAATASHIYDLFFKFTLVLL